ncbi:archaeosortase/exosortase family protein [Thermococcus sp.]
MNRIRAFLLFSIILTLVLFALYRTPFTIYVGLFYAFLLWAGEKRIRERKSFLNYQTLVGATMVAVAPVFLLVKISGYVSPSTFQALALLGISLILFELPGAELPSALLLLEAAVALTGKTSSFRALVGWLSDLFVGMTSILVKDLVALTGLPIELSGNTATVGNSIVIIGSGCSGLDAFAIYLVATLVLIYVRRSKKREALLLTAGALGIIPLNGLRIFTLLFIGYRSGISFLELFHSHLGDLMFVAYVFLYWWWATGKGKASAAS